MEKQILKLTGNPNNYFDNLLYFFETLKNTGFINSFSECNFFFEILQKQNAISISGFLQKNEVYPEINYFHKDNLSLFHEQSSLKKRVNLVYIPEKADSTSTKGYPEFVENLQGLVILTGMNSSSDVFKSLHTWSIILQDDRIVSV